MPIGSGLDRGVASAKKLSAVESASLLAALVDILIPGDENWPSGASVGVQGLLCYRLFEDIEDGHFDRLVSAIVAAGGPLSGRDQEEQAEIVRRFESAEPALFAEVRDATYFAYYESPLVGAAIRASGRPYDMRPHIKGYPLTPFDIARQTPRHGRGAYVPTNGIQHVDISTLDLGSESNQKWGLKR